MQGHMKKHPIEAVQMTFSGPVAMREEALQAMRSLGFVEAGHLPVENQNDSAISWRESEAFKDLSFPGAYLSGFRHREGMTQAELAQRSGVPRRHISEMENGKRPIGKANARKLADVLRIDPRLLLSV
ncbi:XRE family transcriptional regulator [Desulfovibrio sp. OH1186_COT-070]|nr:XRE family transcriptional regulator [Desulfovibrio sp. OH1209_COT-279]RRD87522.1 XRE family transcriptional regulator [Desulfovibrio sp. OH1186_COT-070]